MIADGMLGEIYHVYASFRAYRSIPGLSGDFTTKAVSSGGTLIDWGVHYLDLIIYCLNDPKVLSCDGEAFCKLGKDMKNYVTTSMWAKDSSDIEHGTYDVDDSVVGIVRTDGAVISFNGAWAQNIGADEEKYIDFMGTKGGIRLMYCGNFTYYTNKDGALYEVTPTYEMNDMHRDEVLDFIEAESEDMQHIRGLKRYCELLVLDSLVCATVIGVVQATILVSVHGHLVGHQRVQSYDLVLSVADDLCIGVVPEEQVRHELLPEHKGTHLRVRLVVEQVVEWMVMCHCLAATIRVFIEVQRQSRHCLGQYADTGIHGCHLHGGAFRHRR